MMNYMDKKLGLILNKLRATGLENNTVVFFVGDNGTPPQIWFKADGVKMQGEKGHSTEGGTHVPLIAYWPGHIPPQSFNDDLIDFTDFFTTFADIAKIKDLSNYGTLDGLSFYSRLLKKDSSSKKQLFTHYDPLVKEGDSLKRWVRDKTYKLYDSTGVFQSGKFYKIATDVKETAPLRDNDLTKKQLSIKKNFELILDTVGSWPVCPNLIKPFAINITSSSVTIGAIIKQRGAYPLTEKGSNITDAKNGPYLSTNRLRDSNVYLGKFSQQRVSLRPQTRYKYDLYAINIGPSHNTGFVFDSFYTLSKAPVKQPGKFTAIANNSIIDVEWDDATFPKEGATKAGYLLIYSIEMPALISNINGKSLLEIVLKGRILQLSCVDLPAQPGRKTQLKFSTDSIYNFLLVPYTWDGVNTCTYNYLIRNALKTKIITPNFALTLNKATNIATLDKYISTKLISVE